MLTSKQRASLRGCANQIDTILQVGKGGIGDTLTKQVDDALTARELIKLKVLENCEYSANDVKETPETGFFPVSGESFNSYFP